MSAPAGQTPERLRLDYLDGLRGLAALWVVMHHAFVEVTVVPAWLPERWLDATLWAWNGQLAVLMFIALSGYCLMMPVAAAGELRSGVAGFIKRRARRILPPYYAAMALSLAIISAVPGMDTRQGLHCDSAVLAFALDSLAAHLLLLQDLRIDWFQKIDYPMWTIAQEWQLYFVFALLLLPLWRRVGIVFTVAFAFGVSVALRLLPGDHFEYACPEFLFLFAVGMGAAAVSFAAPSHWLAVVRERLPWGWLTLAVWAGYLAWMLTHQDEAPFGGRDFAWMAAGVMFCTLICCTRSVQRGRRGFNPLLRVCEWKGTVALGAFSYSLYLSHAPVLALFTLPLREHHVPAGPALAVQLMVAVPVAVAVAYGFHLVAERPFLAARPPTLRETERAAVLDPAP